MFRNSAVPEMPCLRLPLAAVAAVIALLAAAPAARAATIHVPGQHATFAGAYGAAKPGDTIEVAAGSYPAQTVPRGSKPVTFRGAGAKVRELDNSASNVTFDGIEVDANLARVAGFENHGADDVTFKNAAIGNVTDEKGAVVSGRGFTFDNVLFHDAVYRTDGVHMECVYAIGVPGFTVRNSTFRDCAVMDLFFTYGDWWSPLPPDYGNVTIENNVFGHPEMEENGGWHYYGLYVANNGPNGRRVLDGWTVRNNTFETAVALPDSGMNGTRWVGNIGSWDCVSGVTFGHNVGKKCAGSDKRVNPAASNRSTTAAIGWVDPAAGDFRLKPKSPAVGAADPSDAPATDRDGGARDSRPDAGAYEFGATGGGGPGHDRRRGDRRAGRALRGASLSPRVICKRRTRSCPSKAKLRLAHSNKARVVVRVKRLRAGRKPRSVRSLSSALAPARTVRIRARGLRRGRYRIVLKARDGASVRRFGLRIR